MKHVFILNPKAGKYSIHQLKEEIGKTFGAYDYVIEETKGRHDATRIAKEYARTGLDLCFYACGGDGTLHEVVNGMYHSGFQNILKCGVIPFAMIQKISSCCSVHTADFSKIDSFSSVTTKENRNHDDH